MLTLEKMGKIKELNVELLETLLYSINIVNSHATQNNLPLLTDDRLIRFLNRVNRLMREVNEELELTPEATDLIRGLINRDVTEKRNNREGYRAELPNP